MDGFNRCTAILMATAGFAMCTPVFAQLVSQAPRQIVRDECTFSDGGTIAFGLKAFNANESRGDVWRAGRYQATTFRVSERMLIPPLDHQVEIPPGSYTLFVDPNSAPPWTLIVSRKAVEPGMPYPGEQYDLGRALMGSDVRSGQPLQTLVIGCTQNKDAPIFVWMESGTRVALAKIMVEKTQQGKTEYLWH